MYNLYSARMKNREGEPEIYEYDSFPGTFRNQLMFILSDVFDFAERKGITRCWEALHDQFSRELGLKSLSTYQYSEKRKIELFLDNASDIDFLDFVDYAFNLISTIRGLPFYCSDEERDEVIDGTFEEINFRFKQHNLGYEFVNEELIRKDNEHIHQNVIKPSLRLLIDTGFAGAEKEFLEAFEHRRKGENKDAILDALKAFESTMKSICDGMGYPYDPAKSTAKELITILEANGFYPAYMNSHMTSLRTSLESGLPTLRNKNAGHGQGATVVSVSAEFTEYALNLAATNIVLLTKIYTSKKK